MVIRKRFRKQVLSLDNISEYWCRKYITLVGKIYNYTMWEIINGGTHEKDIL